MTSPFKLLYLELSNLKILKKQRSKLRAFQPHPPAQTVSMPKRASIQSSAHRTSQACPDFDVMCCTSQAENRDSSVTLSQLLNKSYAPWVRDGWAWIITAPTECDCDWSASIALASCEKLARRKTYLRILAKMRFAKNCETHICKTLLNLRNMAKHCETKIAKVANNAKIE